MSRDGRSEQREGSLSTCCSILGYGGATPFVLACSTSVMV